MDAIFAAAFALLLGVVLLWTGFKQLRNRAALDRWPSTKGKVIERGIYQPVDLLIKISRSPIGSARANSSGLIENKGEPSRARTCDPAGKHVLCEKPMAMNVDECDRMTAACRANYVKLGIAYYRHFYPAIKRIKEIIAEGEIGHPVIAQINAFEWFNPKPSSPRHWLIEKAQAGGGPMLDFGCHRIEVLLNILGPITRTAGVLNKVIFERHVEDTGVAVFQFEQGTLGVLSITHAAWQGQDTVAIFGSEGAIQVESLNEGTVAIRTRAGDRVEKLPPDKNLHQPLIDDFARAVMEGREPQVDSVIGREVARVEALIYAQGVQPSSD